MVNNLEDQESLQSDIDNLTEWSSKWQLEFNTSKCKYMHLGTANANLYKMGNENIQHTSEEKDLGVTIDNKLKFQHHICIQIKKANQKLGIIRRSFTYEGFSIFYFLYISCTRYIVLVVSFDQKVL